MQFLAVGFQRLMKLQCWGVVSPHKEEKNQAATKWEILLSVKFPAVQHQFLPQNVNKLLLFSQILTLFQQTLCLLHG